MKRPLFQGHRFAFLISAVSYLLIAPQTAYAQDEPVTHAQNEYFAWVILAVAGILYVAFGSLRWALIARAVGSECETKHHACVWLGSEGLTRTFFIFPVGEAYRWWRYSRSERRPMEYLGALLIEKAVGACSIVVVTCASILVLLGEGGTPFARFRTLIFGAFCAAFVVLLFATLSRPKALAYWLVFVPSARMRRHGEAFLESLTIFMARPRELLKVFGLSVGMHAGFFAVLATAWSLVMDTPVSSWTSFLHAGLWFVSPVVDLLLANDTLASLLAGSGGDLAITGALFVEYFGLLFAVFPTVFILSVFLTRRWSIADYKTSGSSGTATLDWEYARLRSRDAIRNSIICVSIGTAAAGFCVGVLEAHWLVYWGRIHDELRVLWWAPVAYGLVGALTGPLLALFFSYVMGFREKETPYNHIALASMALWLATGMVIIGRFRYIRDILNDQPMSVVEVLVLGVVAVFVTIVLVCLTGVTFYRFKRKSLWVSIAGVAAIVLLITESRYLVDLANRPTELDDRMLKVEYQGPAIIFIGVDTLRADYLSMYNPDSVVHTPNLDAFRRDGILLENFYATAPWTKPTFASMFTGMYPTEHRALGKGSVLPEEVETLSEILYGYSFFNQGFPNNPNIHAQYGFAQGFHAYDELKPIYPFFGERSVFGTALYQILRRARAAWLYPRVEVETHYRPAEYVTDVARKWIAKRPGRAPEAPFFLFLHYMDPHDPYMPGDDSGHGMSLMELGLHPDPDEWQEKFNEAYVDEIERLDAALGDLFASLRERSRYDESLIVLVSDHGEEFFDHGGWWHGMTLYEEMLRVPCLIKLPENERAGETYTGLASQVDLAPTILDVVGIETATEFSGRSLFGEEAAVSAQEVFAESNFVGARLRTVRRGDLKYIDGRSPIHAPHEMPMLFDLEADAGEQENLAGAHDEEELMRQRLQEWEERLRAGRVR